jgi:two-component system LytT family sensor kinase
MIEGNNLLGLPLWRKWQTWFAIWLAGTAGLFLMLAWDAWPWIHGEAQATFRYTRLNRWPIECLWWLLLPLILWLQSKLTMVDRRWAWTLVLHALMAVGIAGFFIVVQAFRVVLANHLPASFLPVVVQELRWVAGWSYIPALIYFLIIFGLYAGSFYREWRSGQRLTQELTVANAQLETRLVRASLDALKMQLHPHFLFNTLNSITGLIRKDRTREAEDVVAGLGELLRRSLEHRQEARETLDEGLVFLRRYFDIECIRFQDRLKVEYDIDPRCLRALVASLVLQPLVENAMKHGISRDAGAGLLRITAVRDGTRLILTVYNDGPELPKDDAALSQGIGIQNTVARLHMLYGDEARLRLRNQPPRGVRAEVILPFQTNTS